MGHLFATLAVQPYNLQHFPNAFFRHAAQRLHDTQVFFSGEMAVVAGAFDQTAHLPQHGQPGGAVHLLAQHPDAACCGLYQPQNHFQRGGFSRAVGAEKAVDAALGHIQIQMGHPQGISVLFAQIVCFDDVHGKTSLCLYPNSCALRAHEGNLTIT